MTTAQWFIGGISSGQRSSSRAILRIELEHILFFSIQISLQHRHEASSARRLGGIWVVEPIQGDKVKDTVSTPSAASVPAWSMRRLGLF